MDNYSASCKGKNEEYENNNNYKLCICENIAFFNLFY